MKRNVFLIGVILSLLFSITMGFSAEEDSAEDLFFKANQAYKEDRYQDAIDGYLKLLEGGYENGHIAYNLGNAYLRVNNLGKAILFYERARVLMPRDADLNFNLKYAHDQIQDAIPVSGGVLSQSFFWLNGLTFKELFWSFFILNVAFFLILFIRLFYKAEWTYYLFFILLIFAIIAGGSFSVKWYQLGTDSRAVMLKKEVNVLSGPDPRDTVLFKLHEGAIVKQERLEDDWVLVQVSDEKRGWVPAKDLEKILQAPKWI